MKIYLVRHGETDWNKTRRLQGGADVPLNAYGIELAEITSEKMKEIPIQVIYSSPLIRAWKTAEIMKGDRNIPVFADERLREMNFGIYEGMNYDIALNDPEHAIHNFWEHPEKYYAEEGETFEDVMKRAQDFIDEVLVPAQKQYETVMLATHGAFIRCFVRCAQKRDISSFWEGSPQKNCAVTTFEMSNGKLTLLEEGKTYYE